LPAVRTGYPLWEPTERTVVAQRHESLLELTERQEMP